MKAIVVARAGGPEVLEIKEIPTPDPKPGWVLIRVKAFGLNRAEIFTREGDSPDVAFPRVLGIEAVGVVEAAPETDLSAGQKVVAVVGGMGRQFDGGYAEYTLVPASHAYPVTTDLDWPTLAAIPETFQTAWGALNECLEIAAGQTLLIRGGTSSVGMAACAIAKDAGLTVATTTRNPAKTGALRENGADHVVIDDGRIEDKVRTLFPEGVDRILELIGVATVEDSLRCAAKRGVVCMAGILGGQWIMPEFYPGRMIPTSVKLTYYSSTSSPISREAMQALVDGVSSGRYRANLDRVFAFDEIAEAHRYMEANRAAGKIVVVVD